MYAFGFKNVNEAFPILVQTMKTEGVTNDSRNGPVLRFKEPVCIRYERCHQRVLFDPIRDANPYFHFFETLWMLAGRNDLQYLVDFNPRMLQYSDDERTVFGSAYGYRWRKHFGFDQLDEVVRILKERPNDRRCVISMWSALDLKNETSKDLPCNTQIYVQRDGSYLDITVTNRSNDMIWGMLGSNYFHFSFLLEYLAGRIGVDPRFYHQFTVNLHAYAENPVWKRCAAQGVNFINDLYGVDQMTSIPLFQDGVDPDLWDSDLQQFFRDPFADDYHHGFFYDVAIPMLHSHLLYRKKEDSKRYRKAMEALNGCKATDLMSGCIQWLARREKNAEANRSKKLGGVQDS